MLRAMSPQASWLLPSIGNAQKSFKGPGVEDTCVLHSTGWQVGTNTELQGRGARREG